MIQKPARRLGAVTILLTVLLAPSCTAPGPRALGPATSQSIYQASARVTDPGQAVQLTATGLSIALPAGALADVVAESGAVDVTARLMDFNLLDPMNKAGIIGATNGATALLGVLQLLIQPQIGSRFFGTAGLGARALPAIDAQVALTFPDNITCGPGRAEAAAVSLDQVSLLEANLFTDGGPRVNGTIRLPGNTLRHLILFRCPGGGFPPATPTPTPTVIAPSTSPTPTPTPTPADPLAVVPAPAVLSFQDVTDPPQSFTVSQPAGSGSFTLSSGSCTGSDSAIVARVSPTSGPGPFTVTPAAAGACSITVTGASGRTGNVAVRVHTTVLLID